MRKGQLFALGSVGACLMSMVALVIPLPASAADSSAWDQDMRSAVRLVAAQPRIIDGTFYFRAGIEIKLHSSWKVYGFDPRWKHSARNLSASRWEDDQTVGVPPVLDFSASENLKSVTVLWPKPTRFGSADSYYAYGYADNVVWPLRLLPKDRTKPIKLRVIVDYAVFEILAVPAKAKAELELSAADGAFDALVSAAEASVEEQPR